MTVWIVDSEHFTRFETDLLLFFLNVLKEHLLMCQTHHSRVLCSDHIYHFLGKCVYA